MSPTTRTSTWRGRARGDILSHEIMINADRFTPVDSTLIPTGELRAVAGGPFDFRKPMTIGSRITANDEQIKFGKGYDHNFVLNGEAGTLRQAVRVTEKTSGRVMDVYTTEPGVQFYTGNFLDGTLKGKGGKVYAFRNGFCLETQHFPNSPEHTLVPVDGHQGGRALQVANRVSLLDIVTACVGRESAGAALRFRSRSLSSPRNSARGTGQS